MDNLLNYNSRQLCSKFSGVTEAAGLHKAVDMLTEIQVCMEQK